MPHHADSPPTSNEPLFGALLDYAKAPGKYHVAQRQPELLFASIREVLQIAAGREPDAGPATGEVTTELRRAACFFTRTALLFPGADHYALMGVSRNVDAAELKDRYRLLMRLIHPDFAGASAFSWPADAAVRVNQAHDVLSSAVQRRDYDARLAATANAPALPVPVEQRRSKPAARVEPGGMSRLRLKQLAIIGGVAGGGVVLIGLVAGAPDGVDLVQRARPPVLETSVAVVQAPAAVPPLQRDEFPAPLRVVVPPPPSRIERVIAAALPKPDKPAAASTAVSKSASAPALAPAPVPVPAPLPALVPPPALALSLPDTPPAPAPAPAPAPVRVARPEPPLATPSLPAAEPAPAPLVLTKAPPSPAPVPRPAPIAGVSLAEAQPLLSILLQQLESGRGDRVIDLLDREARNKPGAQALSRQYDGLVEGIQPVRLSHVEFKAEPAEGRLLVTGHIRLQVGEQTIGSLGKKMVLRAEFVSRDGTVVMTGLSGGAGN